MKNLYQIKKILIKKNNIVKHLKILNHQDKQDNQNNNKAIKK